MIGLSTGRVKREQNVRRSDVDDWEETEDRDFVDGRIQGISDVFLVNSFLCSDLISIQDLVLTVL